MPISVLFTSGFKSTDIPKTLLKVKYDEVDLAVGNLATDPEMWVIVIVFEYAIFCS